MTPPILTPRLALSTEDLRKVYQLRADVCSTELGYDPMIEIDEYVPLLTQAR